MKKKNRLKTPFKQMEKKLYEPASAGLVQM